MVKDEVEVADGFVTIHSSERKIECQGREYNHTSGYLLTDHFKDVPNATCAYWLAANCSLPARKYIGAWPAFWTWSQTDCWPGGGEIDMMEYNGNPLLPVSTASYHWARNNPDCKNGSGDKYNNTDMEWKGFGRFYTPLAGDLPEYWHDFHVFSAKWYNDKIEFFLDGSKTPTYTKRAAQGVFIADTPQHLILDQLVQKADDDWLRNYDDETKFVVDWVRVYQQCT